MFKWLCLGVGSLFLAALLWMVNDIRLQVRRSAGIVHDAGETINDKLPEVVASTRKAARLIDENLPPVLERTRESADLIALALPDLVDRVRTTAEVLAELAEDIRQLKELAGAGKDRDKNLIAYTNGLLSAIEKAGGRVGVGKTLSLASGTIKNARPVAEWVADARKEALFLMLLVSTKKDMATKLAKTKLGFDWWIETPGNKPVRLIDWMKENHPETRALAW